MPSPLVAMNSSASQPFTSRISAAVKTKNLPSSGVLLTVRLVLSGQHSYPERERMPAPTIACDSLLSTAGDRWRLRGNWLAMGTGNSPLRCRQCIVRAA